MASAGGSCQDSVVIAHGRCLLVSERRIVPGRTGGQRAAASCRAFSARDSRSWAASASSRVWATLVTACITPPAVTSPPRMKCARMSACCASVNRSRWRHRCDRLLRPVHRRPGVALHPCDHPGDVAGVQERGDRVAGLGRDQLPALVLGVRPTRSITPSSSRSPRCTARSRPG